MATAVASRFAVLTVEGEDDYPKKNQQKKKTDNKKPGSGNQKSDANQKKKNKKQESGKQQQQQQQQKNSKPKAKSSAKGDANKQGNGSNKKKANAQGDQWDQWKQKDSEFVEVSYERDLQQAILLSKLDYEEKKDVYEQLRKETAEQEKRQGTNGGGKRAKKQQNRSQPMSLEQFNNMVESDGLSGQVVVEESENEHSPIVPTQIQPDTTFFERIQSDTKKVLDREHSEELRKAREPFIEEMLLVAQLQDALEKKKEENELLKQEISELREELLNVRSRNKKLCQILAHGEMKDKAEVLLEVDRLQQMRDELSSEVSSLHTLLEQERSKVRALTSDVKNKSQNKKRSSTETVQ